MNYLQLRRFSSLIDLPKQNPSSNLTNSGVLGRRFWIPLPIPHRTIPEPKGQDLDFVNVAYSHLLHTDWVKLNSLALGLTPFRIKHILLKIQKDHVLSLEFFNWVEKQRPNSHTLESHSIMLHILTKANRFKAAESLLKSTIIPKNSDSSTRLFESILSSYRLCDSSSRVFDSLFKTYAHMKKFRNATDTFCRMKDYGFLPNIESCNAYLSSLLDLNRSDIALAFYREMGRSRISPNSYTLNMLICALCRSGKLEKAIETFKDMENLGFRPTVASFNTLITGHCNQGLLSAAVKLKNSMGKNGCDPNVITYNTLIHGFCREGKLNEANRIFNEMKTTDISPNTITYNTLINGYSKLGNSEMSSTIYEEMLMKGVKADILTYNGLILGLCKEGKTKKAAYLVKELDKENLFPNASTFSALITGQCVRQSSERAFQIYKTMKRTGCSPNTDTFKILVSTFCKNEDFEGAVQVYKEMVDRSMASEPGLLLEICEGLCRLGKSDLATSLCNWLDSRDSLPKGFDRTKFVDREVEIKSKEDGDNVL